MRQGWVAHSVDEYVAHALAAASDVPRLARLRAGLRDRMLASRLCNAPAFVRSLEDVYRCSYRRTTSAHPLGAFRLDLVGPCVRHILEVPACFWE